MSKFTKCLVLFLLVALLVAQMLPVHAASAENLPQVNPNLFGIINGQDNMQLFNLSKMSKVYLEYRENPNMGFDNVVLMLNQNNMLTTCYLGADNRVYLEDEQDHRFVEPAYALGKQIYDLAPAPLGLQVSNDCVVVIPADNANHLQMISLSCADSVDNINVPFPENVELAAVAAKHLENLTAEYYVLDRTGGIWVFGFYFPDYIGDMGVSYVEKVVDTGVLATNYEGFYYDGELIYRTYYTAEGSCLMAIDPETKAIYNYGVVESGVTIWGLYDACNMAPNCNDVPEPIDTLDATFNGLFCQDGQGDNHIVTIKTEGMQNFKQHLEFRGNSDLVLQSVICQENADGEIETYYIGEDKYIYVEDKQDHRFLDRTVRLDCEHWGYAPGPLDYQNTNGWAISIYNGDILTLTSLFTGEDENCIDLIGLLDWRNNAIPVTAVAIAAKSLVGSEAEYYLLDMDGKIWSATISFPEFKLIEWKEIADTCEYASTGEGFYFNGTWLFRTKWDNNKNASVIYAYHPETDILYDLGIVEQGMAVYGLHEAGKIPTVEPHEHTWTFDSLRWDTIRGYKAYAAYSCSACNEECEVEATVTQLNHSIVSKFEAVVTAEQALDGTERKETMTILPTFGGFEWNTTNGIKAYAIYVCKVYGCYDHQYRVEATVTKADSNKVNPKYKAVVTAEQAPDGIERTETKTIIQRITPDIRKKELTPIKPSKPLNPRLP